MSERPNETMLNGIARFPSRSVKENGVKRSINAAELYREKAGEKKTWSRLKESTPGKFVHQEDDHLGTRARDMNKDCRKGKAPAWAYDDHKLKKNSLQTNRGSVVHDKWRRGPARTSCCDAEVSVQVRLATSFEDLTVIVKKEHINLSIRSRRTLATGA